MEEVWSVSGDEPRNGLEVGFALFRVFTIGKIGMCMCVWVCEGVENCER